MKRFTVSNCQDIWNEGYTEFVVSDSLFGLIHGYSLLVTDPKPDLIRFFVDTRFYRGTVTGRNLNRYLEMIPIERMEAERVLEIGAGLGEFVPYMVENGTKPVVIDPARYKLMAKMLRFATNLDWSQNIKLRLQELEERCRVITDKTKVDLKNVPVGYVITRGLIGGEKFDLVVDFNLSDHYMVDDPTVPLYDDWRRSMSQNTIYVGNSLI